MTREKVAKDIISQSASSSSQSVASSSSVKGKEREIIRGDFSEQLSLIKSDLESFQFNEVTDEMIKHKLDREIKKFGLDSRNLTKVGAGVFLSNVPIVRHDNKYGQSFNIRSGSQGSSEG